MSTIPRPRVVPKERLDLSRFPDEVSIALAEVVEALQNRCAGLTTGGCGDSFRLHERTRITALGRIGGRSACPVHSLGDACSHFFKPPGYRVST